MKKILMYVIFALTLVSLVLVLPAASMENGKIAFVSYRDNYHEIYIMNPDGSNPTRITNNDVDDDFPEWSPNGTKIAFISKKNVYVMNADGSNPIQLTDNSNPLISFESPTWSPDGTKIAFTWDEYLNDDGGYSVQIYVVDTLQGSTPIQLTSGTEHHFHPAWSPDGTKIAFELWAGENSGIYTMDTDGSNQKPLTNGNDRQPAWSSDGTKIAFVSDDNIYDDNIYVMDADGSNPTLLTDYTYPDAAAYPTWSPDGTKIAFIANPDGYYEIYVMDSDGTDVTSITENTYSNTVPSWGPYSYQSPVANAGANQTVIVMEPVPFDGSGSTDSDGTIVSYDWDFGDSASGSGVTITHTYAVAGIYTVALTVTDNDGLKGSDTATIMVKTPAQTLQDLINKVDGLGLPKGIEQSLLAKLDVADKKITQEQYTPARNALNAFINEVNAQLGKALTIAQADELIATAQLIINAIPGK